MPGLGGGPAEGELRDELRRLDHSFVSFSWVGGKKPALSSHECSTPRFCEPRP